MSLIERKFTTEFEILRQEWRTVTDGTNTIDKSEEVVVGTFSGFRQQGWGKNPRPDYTSQLGLEFSKTYTVWCPPETEVFEGDTLRSKYGIDTVKIIQTNDYGRNTHKELVVEFIGFEVEGS